MEIFGKMAVFPGGYGRIGVYRVYLLYISIAYYMQKGGEGVQITCKIAYILNGRPLPYISFKWFNYCNF